MEDTTITSVPAKVATTLFDAILQAEGLLHPERIVKDAKTAYELLNIARSKAHSMMEGVLSQDDEVRSGWLQRIYSMQPSATGLIYEMDKMDFRELHSLISSCMVYLSPHGTPSFSMPRWISDKHAFSLYDRSFTILTGFCMRDKGVLTSVRIIVEDVDDGDNCYDLHMDGIDRLTDEHHAVNVIKLFVDLFGSNSIIDAEKLKRTLAEQGFHRS